MVKIRKCVHLFSKGDHLQFHLHLSRFQNTSASKALATSRHRKAGSRISRKPFREIGSAVAQVRGVRARARIAALSRTRGKRRRGPRVHARRRKIKNSLPRYRYHRIVAVPTGSGDSPPPRREDAFTRPEIRPLSGAPLWRARELGYENWDASRRRGEIKRGALFVIAMTGPGPFDHREVSRSFLQFVIGVVRAADIAILINPTRARLAAQAKNHVACSFFLPGRVWSWHHRICKIGTLQKYLIDFFLAV